MPSSAIAGVLDTIRNRLLAFALDLEQLDAHAGDVGPVEPPPVPLATVSEALDQAEQGNRELRELAHGILPAVLTQRGLRAGVDALVARLDLAVGVDVPAERLPAEIEASAYFIVHAAHRRRFRTTGTATRVEARALAPPRIGHITTA